MKPYYRIKGAFPDGRNKIVIEEKIGRKVVSITLPKPEKLREILSKYRTGEKPSDL